MADVKITALTVLTAADPINDAIPIVDVSNPSMAASGTTSRISINNLLSSSPTATGALTVTGLVTAGSASITGDLTVDTSTLKVDSTNNRVGINNATPGVALHLGTTSGTNKLAINTALTSGGDIQLRRGAFIGFSNAADAANSEYLFANGGALEFGINGSTAMTLNTSGNLAFATGKGIDFSAVTGGTGTATANVLNDYEEGTWVPTQGAGLTVVGAFSSNGTYTKVGRLVTINGVVIGATSIAVAATSILCAGLPFSATNEATTTSVNASFTASSFCAINAANLYAVTSMVATTSIRFTATYYV